MNEQPQFDNYLNGLKQAALEQGRGKLRALALHYQSSLLRLPTLQQEIDGLLQTEETLDYEELLKRVEPALKQATDWLFDVDRLPREIADDAEFSQYLNKMLATLTLANMGKSIQHFHGFQAEVKTKQETLRREQIEAQRRAEETEKARREQELKMQAEQEAQRLAEIKRQEGEAKRREKEEARRLVKLEQDPDYQFELGIRYATGKDIEQDEAKAAYWLEKAATQGKDSHQFELGSRYAEGNGVKKDVEKAEYWMEKAALAGHIESQYCLGEHYYYGSIDIGNIIEHLKGSPEYVLHNPEYAEKWLLMAAEKGHSDSQSKLGYLYLTGGEGSGWLENIATFIMHTRISKNPIKAEYWLTKAAESGKSSFERFPSLYQTDLALLYYRGDEIQKDFIKAKFWFEKCLEIDNNCGDALYRLGVIYADGLGINQDTCKADEYLSQLKYDSNITSYCIGSENNIFHDLIVRYADGVGIKNNPFKALYWIDAFLGFRKDIGLQRNICEDIAHRFKHGKGIPMDLEKAEFWLAKAKQARRYGGKPLPP